MMSLTFKGLIHVEFHNIGIVCDHKSMMSASLLLAHTLVDFFNCLDALFEHVDACFKD